LDLRAARIKDGSLHFKWAVPSTQLCEVKVQMFATDGNEQLVIKDENGNNKRFNGEGEEIVSFTASQLVNKRSVGAHKSFLSPQNCIY
jgi:hypothetical protein